MTEALEQAFASNTSTPLKTLRFKHSAITGGAISLVQGYYDITATLEDSTVVTFEASGFGVRLPARAADGKQDLQISLSNVSKEAWTEINAAKQATRTTQEKIIVEYRPFLEADLSAPAGNTYSLIVTETSVTRGQVNITASYTPIAEITFPLKRYYPKYFPGVRYV